MKISSKPGLISSAALEKLHHADFTRTFPFSSPTNWMHLDAFWLPVVEECSVEQLEARLQLLQDYWCVGVQHQRKE